MTTTNTKSPIPNQEHSMEAEIPTDVVPATTTDTTQSSTPTPKPAKKKKVKRSISAGQMHVQATFNNTIITFTDSSGGVLAASSAGACGFRGSKRAQPTPRKLLPKKQGRLSSSYTG